MENRIPSYKRSCVFRKFESGEEQAGSKNKDTVNESLDQTSNEFIVFSEKNKADAKSYCHQDCEQIDAQSQSRAIHSEIPCKSPYQGHQAKSESQQSPDIVD